jgi:hypothetical protein
MTLLIKCPQVTDYPLSIFVVVPLTTLPAGYRVVSLSATPQKSARLSASCLQGLLYDKDNVTGSFLWSISYTLYPKTGSSQLSRQTSKAVQLCMQEKEE